MLGNGWYNEAVASAWDHNKAEWRDIPKLLLSLECDGEDTVIKKNEIAKITTVYFE